MQYEDWIYHFTQQTVTGDEFETACKSSDRNALISYSVFSSTLDGTPLGEKLLGDQDNTQNSIDREEQQYYCINTVAPLHRRNTFS